MPDHDTVRATIEARLSALDRRMRAIEADLDEAKPKDLEDQAIDLEGHEVLEGVGRAAELETRLLRAALQRLDNGDYGFCVSCGEAISEARLEAVPYAVVCKDCAAKAETHG